MRSVKTTAYDQNNNMQWYLHIFKAQKKFKVRLSSSRNCSVCVRITFDEMESSFPRFNLFVFNFGVGSLEQSAKLGRNFRFPWQFPSLNTTFSKPTTKKQCFLQCFRCLSCFSAAVAKQTFLTRRPLFRLQIFTFSNFAAISKAHIWLTICEFLWLLTYQNVWFVTFFVPNKLSSAFNYLTLHLS